MKPNWLRKFYGTIKNGVFVERYLKERLTNTTNFTDKAANTITHNFTCLLKSEAVTDSGLGLLRR